MLTKIVNRICDRKAVGVVVVFAAALGVLGQRAAAQSWTVTVDPLANCGNGDAPGPTISLAPGSYDITPIAGAFNVWSRTTGCDASGGNCSFGWLILYHIKVGAAPVQGFPAGCCPQSSRWATPALALEHATIGRFQVPGPGVATVKFFLSDSLCADNEGSLTLRVTPSCLADFDADGTVDFFDYDAFVSCFEGHGCPSGTTADFDGDGAVDFFDYDAFVVAFEAGC